eukprot:gene16214-16025_t
MRKVYCLPGSHALQTSGAGQGCNLLYANLNITLDLKNVPFLAEIDFSEFQLDSVKTNVLPYNWKTFIE